MYLAAGDDAGTVVLWDVENGYRKATFSPGQDAKTGGHHSIRALTFSPDSVTMAAGWGSQIHLWDLAKVRWDDGVKGNK